MVRRAALCIAVVICLVAATPARKQTVKKKSKSKSTAAWLASTLGIDPKAFANLTAVRGDAAPSTGTRLVELDLTTNEETTLWECGRCWSPALAGSNLVFLRSDAAGATSMWLLPADGGATRKVVDVPATAILGSTSTPNVIAAAVHDTMCGEKEHALFVVDIAAAKAVAATDAPCVVPPFPARDRILNNRILATTPERDTSGKRIPRRLVVKAPADDPSPSAKRLGSFNDTIDRFDPIWRSATHVIYVADGPAMAESADRPITPFFLHAWIPELGRPPDALTAFEKRLMGVVSLVRKGHFRSSEAELVRLEDEAVTAREQLLLLFFRHYTRARRYVLIDGDAMPALFQLPYDSGAALSSMVDRYRELRPQVDRSDAERTFVYVTGIDVDLEVVPQVTRRYAEARASGIYASLGDPTAVGARMRQAARESYIDAAEKGIIAARDAELLNLIADARIARAQRDVSSAAEFFQKALAVAPEDARVEILLQVGDAHAAPQGSPLLLGANPSTGRLTRTALPRGVRPPSMLRPAAEAISEAQRWYGLAADAANGDAEALRRIVVRRAYLLTLAGDRAGAVKLLEDAAKGDTVTSWAASMSLGLLRNDRSAIERAIAAAAAEEFEGAIVTFADMSQTYALASAYLAGNQWEAIEMLENTADALIEVRQGRVAVEALTELARLYNVTGRQDAAIVSVRQAIDLIAQHLPLMEEYGKSGEIAASELAAERAQLIGLKHARETYASAKRTDEQTGGWTQQNAALVREQEELLEQAFPIAADMLKTSRDVNLPALVELKAEMDSTRRIPECSGRIERLRDIRRRSVEAKLVEWVLIFDIANADCNREWLLEDRKRLESEDILKPMIELLSADQPADVVEPQTRLVMMSLEALEAAEGWEGLAKHATGFEKLTREVPMLMPYAASARRFVAVAAFERGQLEEARQIVANAMSDPVWPSYTPAERMALLSAGIDAEAAICERVACAAVRALHLFELMRHAQREAQFLRTGVAATRKVTAERAALEARLALEETMPAAELQRLRRLRDQQATSGVAAPLPPTLQEVEEAIHGLPNDATAIIFSPGRNHITAWKAHRGILSIHRIPNRDSTIEKLATELQTELASTIDDTWPVLATRLYDALLAPLGAISAGDRILIVAGGTLGRIPYDILRRDGRLLLHDHAFTITDVITGASRTSPAKKTLAVGLNSGPLTTAEDEARAVAQLLRGSALIGPDATLANVRAGLRDTRILHFATHATLLPANPFETYLTLAGGERLEAWRLFREAPAARLITLSACEGAAQPRALAGRAASVSEATSLIAFAFAGDARYVMASLWRADDRFALQMMKSFYRHLASSPEDEAGALHSAKLTVSKNGTVHPYYWTNFVLSARSLASASQSTPAVSPSTTARP